MHFGILASHTSFAPISLLSNLQAAGAKLAEHWAQLPAAQRALVEQLSNTLDKEAALAVRAQAVQQATVDEMRMQWMQAKIERDRFAAHDLTTAKERAAAQAQLDEAAAKVTLAEDALTARKTAVAKLRETEALHRAQLEARTRAASHATATHIAQLEKQVAEVPTKRALVVYSPFSSFSC